MTREEAIDVLKHNYPSACFEDLCEAVDVAIQALSIQPERKKGKWNFIGDQLFVCTECGALYSQSQFEYLRTRKSDPEFPYFCPMCGADMRGEKDE